VEAPSSRSWPDAPRPLLVAAALACLEGLLGIGFGIGEAFHTTSARATMGVSTSLFFVLFGAGIVLCAWGLSRASAWARGPVLIAQLLALGLAWNFKDGDTWPASVVLAVPAVAVLVAMLRPAALAALDDHHDSSD
jgi:peptidoglycan/LPS O-acetylase OafA/YrhL